MRTIKPIRLGVLHRVLELGRKPHLIITLFAAQRLTGPKELVPEFTIWKEVEKSLGTGAILDEGYSKPAAEIVVHGHFHAPNGKAEPVSFAGVEVARDGKKLVDKRVAVLGRREWKSGIPTNPEPVDTLKLDATFAFGGDDFLANPIGRGMKPKDGDAPWLLPQIEDPKHLIRAPGDRPRPAGFGPIDLGSVERRELAGNYGGDYVKTRFPGPAADMDPRFFHTAREDQRIDGFFRGGERLTFVNMHPRESRLEAPLHPLVGRAFLQKGDGAPLIDIPLRIDTVIAFPTDDLLVAVHRAMVPVDEDDASDVTTLVVAAEDPSMPRGLDHYAAVVKRRLARDDRGALWTLQEEDLMPQREAGWGSARMPEEDITLLAKSENLLQKKTTAGRAILLAEKRAELQSQGVDPDTILPPPDAEELPPPVDDIGALVAYLDRMPERMKQEQARSEAIRADLEDKGRKAAAQEGRDWDAEMAQAKRDASGPPKTARQLLERMRMQTEAARAAGAPVPPEQLDMFDDPAILRMAETQYQQLLEGYRSDAHLREPAQRLDADRSAEVRTRFTDARAAGKRPDDVNGTGADLSGLDLSNMDLSGALLECADLRGANLEGANLEHAVLTRAKLDGARLAGANLTRANLGDITFVDVTLDGAKLDRAILSRSRVEKASFAGASVTDANLLEATLGAVDLSRANLTRATFLKLDLKTVKFVGATLEKAQFVECDLSGVDFTEAKLDGAVFVKTRADGACLARASMVKSAWPSEVSAENVDLRGAHIERGCFRGANLKGADLTGAALLQCDLGSADLTGAKLVEIDARGTLFIRTNLARVNARGGSFIEAIFTNAELGGADFSKANLFRAILSRARGDDATRFTGAHVEVVLYEPRHEAKPKEASNV